MITPRLATTTTIQPDTKRKKPTWRLSIPLQSAVSTKMVTSSCCGVPSVKALRSAST